MTIDMTMTAFTGMLKFQLLVEVVIVIVTNHSPAVSHLICKPKSLIYLTISFSVNITLPSLSRHITV